MQLTSNAVKVRVKNPKLKFLLICNKCGKQNTYKLASQSASWCKDCSVNSSKEYYFKNKERGAITRKNWRYKKLYDISFEQYLEMYKNQDERCWICKQWFETLCVDHNHSTGKVRGLLCSLCNTGLSFIEKENFVEASFSYLEVYSN